MPFGYLVRHAFPGWKSRHCVLADALGSFLIETLQGLTGMGMFDVRDIAANTVGALPGVLLLSLLSPKGEKRSGRNS